MAWNDTKSSGDLISSSDWNNMVSDQESRLGTTAATISGDVAIGGHAGFINEYTVSPLETTTIDWTNGNKAAMSMTVSPSTVAFTNPPRASNLILRISQDGTGSRTVSTWDTDIKWADGSAPTLSTAASAIDIISFYFDGSKYYGVASTNFS